MRIWQSLANGHLSMTFDLQMNLAHCLYIKYIELLIRKYQQYRFFDMEPFQVFVSYFGIPIIVANQEIYKPTGNQYLSGKFNLAIKYRQKTNTFRRFSRLFHSKRINFISPKKHLVTPNFS